MPIHDALAQPITVRPDEEYRQHLAQGRFMLLRSRTSGRTMFYPRVAMPVTGEQDLEWTPADGRGTVYSVTVVSVKPPGEPYNVALIDLHEGPRLMSRVEDIPASEVTIGMPVLARIRDVGGEPTLVFVPAARGVPG